MGLHTVVVLTILALVLSPGPPEVIILQLFEYFLLAAAVLLFRILGLSIEIV